MAQRPLRLGLIGVAHRAAVAKNWDEDERAEVVAGADIVDAYLDAFRKDYAPNNPSTTSDWRQLVARDDLDAIGVFTPDNLHAAPAVAALKAGKHVFSEKPMALSVEDCDRMIEAETHACAGRSWTTCSTGWSRSPLRKPAGSRSRSAALRRTRSGMGTCRWRWGDATSGGWSSNAGWSRPLRRACAAIVRPPTILVDYTNHARASAPNDAVLGDHPGPAAADDQRGAGDAVRLGDGGHVLDWVRG